MNDKSKDPYYSKYLKYKFKYLLALNDGIETEKTRRLRRKIKMLRGGDNKCPSLEVTVDMIKSECKSRENYKKIMRLTHPDENSDCANTDKSSSSIKYQECKEIRDREIKQTNEQPTQSSLPPIPHNTRPNSPPKLPERPSAEVVQNLTKNTIHKLHYDRCKIDENKLTCHISSVR